MPRYKVLEKSLVNNQIFEAGDEVEYDGEVSGNLEPLDEAGRAKRAQYEASNKQRIATMLQDAKDSPNAGAVDPSTIIKQMADMQKQQAADTEALMERMSAMFAATLANALSGINTAPVAAAPATPVQAPAATAETKPEAAAVDTSKSAATEGDAKHKRSRAVETPAGTADSADA